jgi:hypothetical protein
MTKLLPLSNRSLGEKKRQGRKGRVEAEKKEKEWRRMMMWMCWPRTRCLLRKLCSLVRQT